MSEPFAHVSGPRDAKVLAIGEAFGEAELASGLPFAGTSGKELFFMLGEAWPDIWPEGHANIKHTALRDMANHTNYWLSMREEWLSRASVLFTNVLNLHPPGNKLEIFCTDKAHVGPNYALPAISRAAYLRPEYLPEVERLFAEIREVRPNLVLALGNTACWALLRLTNIGSIRGACTWSQECAVKVLPTYHPAGVLRQWSWRTVVIADFMKARREAEFPEIRRPERQVICDPTLEDIRFWSAAAVHAPMLSVDIETARGQITCIGFARTEVNAIVIPFIRRDLSSYWPDHKSEVEAWKLVRDLLLCPVAKLFQNGLYDIQYLWKMGFRIRNAQHDTMLLHHSLYPELQKGLGFLGSIYSNEPAWKLMNRKSKQDQTKREE